MKNQLCIVLDFGGQYNQLIARRVRECGVYCEIKKFDTPIEEIKALNPMGIIFTGGPNSVYDETSPHISAEIFEIGVPILGLCYGCQIVAYTLGGKVDPCIKSEFGKIEITKQHESPLFKDIPEKNIVWMSHNDYVSKL
ncbi:MAG: gamma-glutamyl-gamma-aminobutyrate hydrolase family protein, partial [Ruminococcus sp.]|nr:gamma-glutamyl-gamma-aminobutyrate hydrolase family protein [Ruminococcus sp.]